jgi:hypothetical protein
VLRGFDPCPFDVEQVSDLLRERAAISLCQGNTGPLNPPRENPAPAGMIATNVRDNSPPAFRFTPTSTLCALLLVGQLDGANLPVKIAPSR